MSTKIPLLLSPYLALPPEASLTLLTSVLGASTNWLVLRFLHQALLGSSPDDGVGQGHVNVVFVSFLRDLVFWKESARRLGLDLDKFAQVKRFAFVDGLGGLFLSGGQMRRGGEEGGGGVLRNHELGSVTREIESAIKAVRREGEEDKVVLVVDGVDYLLAAGGDGVNAIGMEAMFLRLQEEVHSTIITLSSDLPLVSSSQTPLEANHAAFLLSIAHKADLTISLRLLDTGTARDVSGVLRITPGDQNAGNEEGQQKLEERELLYFVGGDGGVKVFERGQ